MSNKEESLNIYQRLHKITNELGRVAKNLEVSTGKGKGYKAVSEADVLNEVKPLEEKYGIYSYPFSRKIINEQEVKTSSGEYERTQRLMRIETVYRFVNIDHPDEFIDVSTYGDGLDTGDKAPGKAMTYADKYALLKAYKIQTGDDPDKDASPEAMVSSKTMEKFIAAQFRLENLGADTHDDKNVISYICEKASVKSMNPANLSDNEMKRIIEVMNAMSDAKEKAKAKEVPSE